MREKSHEDEELSFSPGIGCCLEAPFDGIGGEMRASKSIMSSWASHWMVVAFDVDNYGLMEELDSKMVEDSRRDMRDRF